MEADSKVYETEKGTLYFPRLLRYNTYIEAAERGENG